MGKRKGTVQFYSSKTIKMSHHYCTTFDNRKIEKFGKTFNNLTIETVKNF